NVSQLTTSVGSLVFSAGEGGDSPLAQSFAVHATQVPISRFTVQVDGGAGKPLPSWLTVVPRAAAPPPRISLPVASCGLRAADSSAGVLVISADSSQPIVLPVSLTVDKRPPALDVVPDYLRLTAPGRPTAPLEASLLLHNAGSGGSITFQASVSD